MQLELRPVPVKVAVRLVSTLHRHLPKVEGGLFATTVERNGEVVGVAIAARPKSRAWDDGATMEIVRVATDGTPNACSRLYGSLCRAATALGYTSAITYTLRMNRAHRSAPRGSATMA